MRPLRQINFVLGLLLLIVGGGALMFGLRNMVAALRHDGFDAAFHAPNGVVDVTMGFAFVVVALAMLRALLRRRLTRLFVIVVAVLVVLLAVHAGYAG
jgi:hypothetical protein